MYGKIQVLFRALTASELKGEWPFPVDNHNKQTDTNMGLPAILTDTDFN